MTARAAGSHPAAITLVGGTALLIGGIVVYPLVRLGWAVLTDHDASIARIWRQPGFGTAAAHSLELAVLVPVLAVPIGTGLALLLRRADVPCRALLRAVVLLPLLVPQFVLGYSWTQSYGRGGFIDDLLGFYWTGLNGFGGILVVLMVDAVPVCYLLATVGLATRAQPELESAARVSGASTWIVLRTIVIPLLRPVLAAALVLSFVLTLESFAVPQVLGTPAGYETLTTRIYADLALGSDPAAFVDAITLAFGLVLVALIILVPADLVLAPRLRSRRTAHTALPATGKTRGVWVVLLAAAVGGYALLTVILPSAALGTASLTRAIGLAPTPSNWTLANFRTALDGPTRDALLHSVELAVLAAVVLTVLGAAVAALERAQPGRIFGMLAMLTFAVPGSALAVGVLISYDRQLGGTLALILLAYLAKFWALAHRAISGAVDRVPPGEWQAARVSGADAVAAVRTVWIPALTPALLGAAVLVLVAALHEVTMSSLLYSTGSETFAVAVLNSQQLGDTATTAAQSVILTVVPFAVVIPIWLLGRLSAHRNVLFPAPPAVARAH